MADTLTPQQWEQFDRDGFIVLGKLLNDADLKALQQRIDDIMLGKAKINYDRMLMQQDSESGRYEDAGPQTKGHKGSHLNYRKIQDLELDPVFLAYMQRPLFKSICERMYGAGVPIGCFRAMFFNKPAHRGTKLPWHQDRWTDMDRDPLVTVWTALDPATKENGCVELIPGSHKSLINPSHPSGFLEGDQTKTKMDESKAVPLVLKAGEVALLHNWTLHSSDVNRSSISRRAFSTCYMDARTICRSGAKFPTLFGPGALTPADVECAEASTKA